jgi:hypothetical protein
MTLPTVAGKLRQRGDRGRVLRHSMDETNRRSELQERFRGERVSGCHQRKLARVPAPFDLEARIPRTRNGLTTNGINRRVTQSIL